MKRRLGSVLAIVVVGTFLMTVPVTAHSATQMFEQALQALPQQDRDTIMDKMAERHIRLMKEQKGLDALTPEERNQLAVAMAIQEKPLLRKYLGQRDIPIHLMGKMRNQVMGNITNDIISHNQELCMPIIQPHMSQEVRRKIQVSTIPMFSGGIIERVRARFKQ
ncbi:MAG: hypothetical protein WGN25_12405 [Candidatus Electrothrix sp. GW3-4]|uniref:hypothetical protein n=1 Tax=Candidatus Electrothrix sp. GW3-4 TaxID=3126740 RepID=UPI0030D04C0F